MANAYWHNAASANVSPRDADAMSRRGFSFRLAFAVLACVAASLVTPLPWLAVWLVLVLVWELWLAQFLTNTLVWPVFIRDPKSANLRQAGVVACGAALFGAFPFLAWSSPTILGAVLAVAWIGGTAIHVFVYLSNHRPQLIVGLVPPLVAALILPVANMGVTVEALASIFATLYLVGAATAFSWDRNVQLVHATNEKAAREAAEATAREKSAFLNAVTHELRTPINHIIGYAGLLEEDIREGGAQPDDAAKVAAAGVALLTLVNRVIEISRLQAGAIELQPYTVDVAGLLHEAAEQISAAAQLSGNQVRLEAFPQDDTIEIDGALLLECLYCLSENAAKFCKDGVIGFSARRLGDDVEFTVSDTGPGLSEETLARIGAPLTQADGAAARQHEGLGLGLTLSRALARALGGSLEVESALGHGTHVRVRVPAGGRALPA